MEVLEHCKVYPLAQFYRAGHCDLVVPSGVAATGAHAPSRVPLSLHLIEHDFRISELKRRLLLDNIEAGSDTEPHRVLIIDTASIWQDTVLNDSRFRDRVCYVNCPEVLTSEGLVAFLSQLNTAPRQALARCHPQTRPASLEFRLRGIVIDNVSYLDPRGHGSATVLLRLLRALQTTYGCWFATVSYGLEFYAGVGRAFPLQTSQSQLYPTMFPIGYLNEMDCVLLRETQTVGRRLK